MIEETPLLFRFHRGGLEESMQTVIEIETFDQLVAHITSNYDVPAAKITVSKYIYDDRINWDTYIVNLTMGLDVEQSTHPVGFLNRKPDWKSNHE